MRSSTPPTTQIIKKTTNYGHSLYIDGPWNNHVRTMLTMQTAVLLRPQLASGQLNTRKLPIDIQFCVKMQSMSSYNGVDWMKRRTNNPTRPIHVTLPIKMVQDFDQTLRYNQSRSKKIASLIDDYMNGDGALVRETNTRQLLRAICNREDTDETLRTLLLQILAK